MVHKCTEPLKYEHNIHWVESFIFGYIIYELVYSTRGSFSNSKYLYFTLPFPIITNMDLQPSYFPQARCWPPQWLTEWVLYRWALLANIKLQLPCNYCLHVSPITQKLQFFLLECNIFCCCAMFLLLWKPSVQEFFMGNFRTK